MHKIGNMFQDLLDYTYPNIYEKDMTGKKMFRRRAMPNV